MYAAGHPPLPPFELVTYTRDQPKHWKEPGELKYFASLPAEQLRSLFSARPASEELATVKQLAIGVIVALKAEVNLIAANAATLPPHGDLDYARFDCYACHHDLKTPSDRQKRGYDGPPGRPPLKAWIGSMAQIITDHAKQTKPSDVARLAAEFPAKWQAVRDAAYAKPYGDPVRMTQATKPLVAWADDFVMALDESAVYSTEESAKLKSMLAGRISNEKTLADPEAAIALGWAYQSVSMAIDGKPAPTRTALYYYHGLRPTATGTKPVAVGTIAGERLKQFNDFNAGEFLKAIGVK
jgi:hypothetical protein